VDEYVVFRACLTNETPVVVPIVIVQEDRTPVYPALGDMDGNAGYFDSGLARHGADLVGMPAAFVVARPNGIGEMPVGE